MIRLIDAFVELVNNNKIYPACLLLLMLTMMLVVLKMPSSDLGLFAKSFFNVVASSGALIGALIFSNILWCALFVHMLRIKNAEIQRLTDLRSQLLHGEIGNTPIKKHRSSADECHETYMIPEEGNNGVK